MLDQAFLNLRNRLEQNVFREIVVHQSLLPLDLVLLGSQLSYCLLINKMKLATISADNMRFFTIGTLAFY